MLFWQDVVLTVAPYLYAVGGPVLGGQAAQASAIFLSPSAVRCAGEDGRQKGPFRWSQIQA